MVNSPATELAAAIDEQQTSFDVLDGALLPAAPNLATIGQGDNAETILYTVKSGNTFSGVTRGFQGTARAWVTGTKLRRCFTEYDYRALTDNIAELDNDLTAHINDESNPHGVTKAQVGLGSVDNFPTASQSEAEMGTSSNRFMTPLRTKQAIDKRLQNDLTLRYNEGNVEAFNGEEWVSVGGDPTLSNYFGQYGVFPFAGDQDVTINSNTTWDDDTGMRRVKKLTIAAGVTLRIMKTPFFIFADEIEFGDSSSVIDISGPSGGPSVDYSNLSFARGGTVIQYPARAQGGCGGGMIFIVVKKVSGASGSIKSNGGNAWVSAGVAASGSAISSGEGALIVNRNLTASSSEDNLVLGELSLIDRGGSSSVSLKTRRTLRELLGTGGNNGSAATAPAAGSGVSAPGNHYGGSGIGGGGAAAINTQPLPTQPAMPPTVDELLQLAKVGCTGGGGGGAQAFTNQTGMLAGGGGGGSIVLWARDLVITPNLQANGGAYAAGSGTGQDGAAGVTYLVKV